MVMLYTTPPVPAQAAKPRLRRLWPVTLLFIGALAAAGAVFYRGIAAYWPPEPVPTDEVVVAEALLAQLNCTLVPLSTALPADAAVQRYRLEGAAPSAGFYVRYPEHRKAALLRAVSPGAGQPAAVEVAIYATRLVRSAGPGSPEQDLGRRKGAALFEVVPPGGKRASVLTVVPAFEMADGFMRAEFARNDGWLVKRGQWQLNQYGGGIPQTAAQEADFNFQRAVNPFTVVGRGDKGTDGVLLYETPVVAKAENYVAEAAFYFGRPKQGLDPLLWRESPPCFLIAQGALDGPQAGFGWWQATPTGAPAWALCSRTADGPWRVLRHWPQRPAVGNWVKAGVAIRDGRFATAYLDGVELGEYDLRIGVRGPFHIHTGPGGEAVEFDDVHAWTNRAPEPSRGQSVFVSSSNFDAKATLEPRDPIQFEYWARGANTYLEGKDKDAVLGLEGARYTTRLPLYGDFTYRSQPVLPMGLYRFLFLKQPVARVADDQVMALVYEKSAAGWLPVGEKNVRPEFMLEFGRRDGRFGITRGGQWVASSITYPGPVHVMIMMPAGVKFEPAHHDLRGTGIWHELFETSPTDWYWRDGSFGMNLRWACQPGYNFMVGKSPRACALFSDFAYRGDQQIEGYMSFTAVLPADRAYYMRKDLCLSICTDGRNLDSGYALIFGSDYNRRTVLLKRGQEIAFTAEPDFLFPTDPNVLAVHWRWWYFTMRKAGGRLVVTLNDKTLFDVDDPDPLPGGQVAFWTTQNGFVLSRFTAVAEGRQPTHNQHLFQAGATAGPWKSVIPDLVQTRQMRNGEVEVSNPMGGNIFAVRTSQTVNLATTPVLELPLRLDPDAKISLHLEILQKPWLIQITAPTEGMEYLLTPLVEKLPGFGQPLIKPEALPTVMLGAAAIENGRLRVDLGALLKARNVEPPAADTPITLTLGNSSNLHYLLAGFNGNHAGTRYWVGEPKWTVRNVLP